MPKNRTTTSQEAGFYAAGFRPREKADLSSPPARSAADEINLLRVVLRRLLLYLNEHGETLTPDDMEKITRLLLRGASTVASLLRVQMTLDAAADEEISAEEFRALLDESQTDPTLPPRPA